MKPVTYRPSDLQLVHNFGMAVPVKPDKYSFHASQEQSYIEACNQYERDLKAYLETATPIDPAQEKEIVRMIFDGNLMQFVPGSSYNVSGRFDKVHQYKAGGVWRDSSEDTQWKMANNNCDYRDVARLLPESTLTEKMIGHIKDLYPKVEQPLQGRDESLNKEKYYIKDNEGNWIVVSKDLYTAAINSTHDKREGKIVVSEENETTSQFRDREDVQLIRAFLDNYGSAWAGCKDFGEEDILIHDVILKFHLRVTSKSIT